MAFLICDIVQVNCNSNAAVLVLNFSILLKMEINTSFPPQQIHTDANILLKQSYFSVKYIYLNCLTVLLQEYCNISSCIMKENVIINKYQIRLSEQRCNIKRLIRDQEQLLTYLFDFPIRNVSNFIQRLQLRGPLNLQLVIAVWSAAIMWRFKLV